MTTKEPDDDMIEVAIRSVDSVFDWKVFLENKDEEKSKVNVSDLKDSSQDKKVSNKKAKASHVQDTKKVKEAESVQDPKKESTHKKKDSANSEYAVAGEISIASPKAEYEEDDDILKALDKYLDFNDDK